MRISGGKTMRVPSAGDTTMGISLPPCPVCQTPGVPGEYFCLECGLLVGSEVGGLPSAARSLPKLVDQNGREFALQVGDNIVGRDSADVILPSKTVSRRHAVIRVLDSGGVVLEDTNSTNGTRLGEAKINPGQTAALTHGAVVQFGDIYLKAVIPVGEPAAPLPALEAKKTEESLVGSPI
ncbi:MAG: FHA domain-containing protein, partial [Cytophagales bacterium]|nr:FHA domain-containing protein [Armatimonadota bacterium]